jgi:hypothetical protein
VPALQPYLIEPIWEQFRVLLPLFTKCVEGEFCEVRPNGVLGRSHPGSCIAPVQRVSAPFRRSAYPLAIMEN